MRRLDLRRASILCATMASAVFACSSSDSTFPAKETAKPPGGDAGGTTCATADLGTSPQHCGRCDHACLGGDCVGGECQPFVFAADLLALPLRIQPTKDGFAWLTYSNVAVSDGAGGARIIWTAPKGTSGRAFAIGDSWVVVALDSGDVWRMHLDGTEPTRIATDQIRVTAIRARGDTFYWVSAESSELTRFDAAGTSLTVSADTCNPGDFVLDDDRAILLATGSACGGILSVPLAGGPVTPIAQHSGWKPIFGNLVGTTLVWTNFLEGTAGVMATDVRTATTKRLTAEGKAVYPLATAFDGEHVYFSTDNESLWGSEGFESGFVYAMSRTGTDPVLISNIKASVLAIAVRDDLIAWTHDGPRRGDAPAGTDLTWSIMARAK